MQKESTKKTAKERVEEKFNLAEDVKPKIETSIDDIEMQGEKVTARFRISGLPGKKASDSEIDYNGSYRNFTKIFDSFDSFAEYGKEFLSKSDEELIKITRG